MRRLLLILFLLPASLSRADEPIWTVAERWEKRDLVVEGEVKTTRVSHQLNKYHEICVAEFALNRPLKGSIGLPKTIRVYYEADSSGGGWRCPSYAKLKKGQKARFFLRRSSPLLKKRIGMEKTPGVVLFLEMGSDIHEAKFQTAAAVKPKPALNAR